jgi:DDE superfamily endonuclease
MPTLRALWRPRGQQVMLPTPGPPDKRDGLGAVHAQTGQTVVLCRRRKRRREVAERLQAVVDQHPPGTIDSAWDKADPHCDDDGEAVVRSAAGRLVRRYVPTYSPWLNPMAMLWRQCRRDGTHGELFVSLEALLKAAPAFVDRSNPCPHGVRSIIGAHAA